MTVVRKLFVTSLLLTAFGKCSIAQNPDTTNIYYQALQQYGKWVERFEPEPDTLFFEEVKGITNFFPKKLNDRTVILITGRNQAKVYGDQGGSLIHRKMTPALVNGAKIEIGIIPYQGQFSPQTGIRLGLSRWYTIIFEYNPQTRRFEYRRLQNNG